MAGKKGQKVRDEIRCTARNREGLQCRQPKREGMNVCRYHGGSGEHVDQALAKQEVKAMAAEIDLPMPVTTADFPAVASEYVSRFNRHFSRLESEMDALRASGISEIELSRQYPDVYSLQKASASMVTKMMAAFAAIELATPPPLPEPPPAEKMAALLEGIRGRMLAAGMIEGSPAPCQKCGHVYVAPPLVIAEPVDQAEVVEFRPPFI